MSHDKSNTTNTGLLIAEEELDSQTPPSKDLFMAMVLAGLSLGAMVLAALMPAPTGIFTAPGLLPFFTGLSLFFMALALGARAVKMGGGKELAKTWRTGLLGFLDDAETRRTYLLMGIIILYVVFLDFLPIEKRFPVGPFVFQLSGYEVISTLFLVWILRLFWRESFLRCFIVSVIVIMSLANIFRHGFHILLPGSG